MKYFRNIAITNKGPIINIDIKSTKTRRCFYIDSHDIEDGTNTNIKIINKNGKNINWNNSEFCVSKDNQDEYIIIAIDSDGNETRRSINAKERNTE